MRLEALPEIPSEDNFSLKLYMPLVSRIGFVTVTEPPFFDSLITLGNLERESGFECTFLATLNHRQRTKCLPYHGYVNVHDPDNSPLPL